MSKILSAVMGGVFVAGLMFSHVASAADCEALAVSKDGKPLSGAAKNASIKKCEASNKTSGCADKALDKNGKPLAGAAKNSFMKKCEASAS